MTIDYKLIDERIIPAIKGELDPELKITLLDQLKGMARNDRKEKEKKIINQEINGRI